MQRWVNLDLRLNVNATETMLDGRTHRGAEYSNFPTFCVSTYMYYVAFQVFPVTLYEK